MIPSIVGKVQKISETLSCKSVRPNLVPRVLSPLPATPPHPPPPPPPPPTFDLDLSQVDHLCVDTVVQRQTMSQDEQREGKLFSLSHFHKTKGENWLWKSLCSIVINIAHGHYMLTQNLELSNFITLKASRRPLADLIAIIFTKNVVVVALS